MSSVAFAIALFAAASASAHATQPSGTYYVQADVLDEHLAPSPKATSTNKIYRGQRVEVFEVVDGWARVSRFYDGSVEGKPGQVARWVEASGLAVSRPAERPQPVLPNDPRIAKDAFPSVGDGGLTEQDIRMLYQGALKFLECGKCRRVEYGDKSVSKANTYYINCGGPNLFFTPADLR